MNIELIACTRSMNQYETNPLNVVERAASVCYDSSPDSVNFRITKGCKASGHTSVLEHISFTFHITGVSRALLAQLTRHRHASFSVRSQRYCNEENFEYVSPAMYYDESLQYLYAGVMQYNSRLYSWMHDHMDVPAEDVRYVLPNACCTELYMTMNARALIEASRQRLCSRAQWEIRQLFEAMKQCVSYVCPEVADWMRPKCEDDPEHPFCTENKSCGKHPKLAEVYNNEQHQLLSDKREEEVTHGE